MLRIAADQNFNSLILSGVRRRLPSVDVITAHEAGQAAAEDPQILEWAAAREGRILLTHDHRTMPSFVYERVATGAPVPGVVVVSGQMAIGKAIEELVLVLQLMEPEECRDRVLHLPL